MPTGVYHRNKKHIEQMKSNFAKGREPEARKKAKETIKKLAQTDEWRERVSEGTKKAMHRPEVRKKHLEGLKRAIEKHGPNFKGGNGQPLTEIIIQASKILEPLGYIKELPIKTKGHNTEQKPPDNYKVDFGHPELKIAFEYDGTYHRNFKQKKLDRKKDEVLEALGWKIIRITHD